MNNEEKILSMLEALALGQAELKSEVKELKQGQTKLEQGQAKLEQGQAKLEQGQAKLEQGQAETNKRLDKLELGQVRIENEHGKKLDALFDGYIQLYDLSQEIRENMTALQASHEKQELLIKWHDSQLKAK